MTNQWPEGNVPPAKRDFEKTHEGVVSNENKKPVTRNELDTLEAERKSTKPTPQLTPNGVKTPKPQKELERSARIIEIRERLERERGRCRNDFTQKM